MDSHAQASLTSWFATQLIGADDVRIEGLEVADFGHSAETLLFSVAWHADDGDHREEVVLRTRPAGHGLLPPYDLERQFEILRGLDGTSVRSPRALWFEPTGDVLGRDFYVMERINGTVFEQRVPKEIATDPVRIRRMTEAIVEQIAAIHSVDLQTTGLDAIADGHDYLDREMQRWTSELRRLQRGTVADKIKKRKLFSYVAAIDAAFNNKSDPAIQSIVSAARSENFFQTVGNNVIPDEEFHTSIPSFQRNVQLDQFKSLEKLKAFLRTAAFDRVKQGIVNQAHEIAVRHGYATAKMTALSILTP